MKLSGREKATIFLSILGTETASAILRYLPKELADAITASINHLPTPTPEALFEVFEDFKSYVALPSSSKSQEIPIFTPGNKNIDINATPEEKLASSSPKKIAYLLADERPQIAAFMLSTFPPMQREEILMNITAGREQIDILLKNIKPSPYTKKIQEKLTDYFAEKV